MIIPSTQSIKYAGSKLKLLNHITSLIDSNDKTILDGFSGSTRVSQAFSQLGCKVISNDISEWSYILGNCYLKHNKPVTYYQELINHLNSLNGYDGWFTENYGGIDNNGSSVQKDGLKKIWQIHNTRKLDAIREEINTLNISEIDKSVLLTSLLLALDEVDNTMGHQSSYLRDWAARSYQNIHLKVPQLLFNNQEHIVLKQDIFKTLDMYNVDFAYFDPPYGSNNKKMPSARVRYACYYHLYTTIILNDKPETFGKSKRRIDSKDSNCSVFESFKKTQPDISEKYQAVDKLIKDVQASKIAYSYSTEGFLTLEELMDIFNKHCKNVKVHEIDYKRNVMSGMSWTDEYKKDTTVPHKELLFVMEK